MRIAGWMLLLLSATRAAAAEPSHPLADAIATAQPRCVKLLGAGIGVEHGYAVGMLVSSNGLILCAQGIHLATPPVQVVLPDGRILPAEVVARSEPLQAALLRVEAATPEYFELPATFDARPGDWVLAIHNAFKVADKTEPLSANLGVIGARMPVDAKRKTQDVPYDGDALLLDAITSNPGAAGGPVLTPDGRLVGMIGRVLESKSTNTRLNYAVPIDRLRPFVQRETAATNAAPPVATPARRPFLGFRLLLISGKDAPAYVDKVAPGSPAAKAGLQSDDLILTVNGEVVRSCGEYLAAEKKLVPGHAVQFAIKRQKAVLQMTIAVAEEPAHD